MDVSLIVNGGIVFFMQTGFAFLQCGSVRSKNAASVLMTSMLILLTGTIAYWLIGFGVAHGDGGDFLGTKYFALHEVTATGYAIFFFSLMRSLTAASIVSGAIAERCELMPHIMYAFVIAGFVSPSAQHWSGSTDGWLIKGFTYDTSGQSVYHDAAGCGAVHLVGGTCALVGSAILRARIGRFDSSGRPREIKGHSVPLIAVGGFILFFGFFSLNGAGSPTGQSVANTMIAGAFGGVTTLLVRFTIIYTGGRPARKGLVSTINGVLTGMVAVSAGLNLMLPWAAAVTGAIAGLVYMGVSAGLLMMKVDDPVDAVAVHFGGAIWGLIAAPLLAYEVGIVYSGKEKAPWMNLGWNLVGTVAIIAWAGVASVLVFGVLRVFKALRVHPRVEKKGLDIMKLDEVAYPYSSDGDAGWDDAPKTLRRPREEYSYADPPADHLLITGRHMQERPRHRPDVAPRYSPPNPRKLIPKNIPLNSRMAMNAAKFASKAFDFEL